MPTPSVGRIVHYRSHGTPGGEYKPECRAAIITEVSPGPGAWAVSLCVLNPTGQFFNQNCAYDEGGETPGAPDCPDREAHGNPFRYCPCGWMEAAYKGGTWHWPESAPE